MQPQSVATAAVLLPMELERLWQHAALAEPAIIAQAHKAKAVIFRVVISIPPSKGKD